MIQSSLALNATVGTSVQQKRLELDSTFFGHSATSSSTIKFHVDKHIVRTPRPQHLGQWLNQYTLPSTKRVTKKPLDLVSSLASDRTWKSTTASAMQHDSTHTTAIPRIVPSSTKEELVDPVQSLPRAYNKPFSLPMLWQETGRKWDSVQRRGPFMRKCCCSNREHDDKGFQHLQDNTIDCEATTATTTTVEVPRFLRPIPNYMGHTPRHPIPCPSLRNDRFNAECVYCSSTHLSFRLLPPFEYRKLPYCRNGPFSKAIVLTCPHNPFKRILNEGDCPYCSYY